jgi:magnesium chelatase family protein
LRSRKPRAQWPPIGRHVRNAGQRRKETERMTLAVIHSRSLDGLAAPEVTVEVHLANGLPSFTLVGLADTEVKESRERVRAALQTSGLEFPSNKRITVNLAPADLPKESGRFDLPIALGILAASGQLDAARLEGFEFAGELSLAGDLRRVRGALAMGLALSRHGTSRALVLPAGSAEEAALVEGLAIHAAAHLLDVVRAFVPGDEALPLPRARPAPTIASAALPDLRDVKGQAGARRALEIAAAGGHSVLMVGPPGTGKSMLAQRFGGLLPQMTQEEALESAAVLSLTGDFQPARWRQRVLRAPHHSASPVALVGGGSPPRPGEISLAHHGVLFLDELPEFPRAALEALREPLESGRITISRAARQAEFPARFQFLAAMNPCPCGHLGSPLRSCRCTPDLVARYQGRISGPLLDRIDLQVEVPAVAPEAMSGGADAESSADVALRVARAHARQLERQGCRNADLAGDALEAHCALDAAASKFLQTATARLGWSARSFHRVLRIARSVADVEGAATIQVAHLAEAIQYRRVLGVG